MKLYKYLSFDSAVRLLMQGAVRFTPATAFNDPFELHPSFDLMSKEDIQKLPDDPNNPGQKLFSAEIMQEVYAALSPGIQKAMAKYAGKPGMYALRNNDIAQYTLDSIFGILCLTEQPDSLLMWAHYADNHNGIAIQFDGSHPFLSTADFSGGPVIYCDERPVLSYSNFTSPVLFFQKSTEWAYEREWRFIRYLHEADQTIEAAPSPIHLFGLPPDLITGIIIGVGVEHEKRVEVMELCSTPPLEHVTVFQTRLCDKSYKLEIHPPLDGKVDPAKMSGEICGGRDADGNVDPYTPSLMLMFEVPDQNKRD